MVTTLTVSCSANPQGASSSESVSASPAVSRLSSTLPTGWHRIDNRTIGLSIGVPRGWTDIDVNSANVAEQLKQKFQGTPSEVAIVEKGAAELKGKKMLFIIDTHSIESGFTKNISGLCVPNDGAPAEAFGNITKIQLARIGGQNVQADDVVIGGRPAVKASYTLESSKGSIDAVQFRILMPGDVACAVTIGTRRGEMLPEVDQIGGTIRPL